MRVCENNPMAVNMQPPPTEDEECLAEASPLEVTDDVLMDPSWWPLLVSIETTEIMKALCMWSLGGDQSAVLFFATVVILT